MIPRSRRNLLFASEREGFVFGNADRHQGIHDRMGMQRIRWEGDGGCTGAGAVEREG